MLIIASDMEMGVLVALRVACANALRARVEALAQRPCQHFVLRPFPLVQHAQRFEKLFARAGMLQHQCGMPGEVAARTG
jgi:hypothetical protein